MRFSGVAGAELIGAKVTVLQGSKQLGNRWIHGDHAYKSSGALEAHFGLRKVEHVALLSGRTVSFKNVSANRFLDVGLKGQRLSEAK